MFASYHYPMYRYPVYAGYGSPYGYPSYGYGGYPSYGYGGYGGSNFIGSAVGYNSVINTGTAAGINQVANPIVF
jgi:hypothetical protein